MRRQGAAGALVLACCGLVAGRARAERLLDLGGRVALADGVAPDGVRVKLQVDLDRNNKLDSFETLTADVGADGAYQLAYELDPRDVDFKFVQFVGELVADYQARGFEALLDGGPLPVVLSFEREGYSTAVKRFTTLASAPSLDVVLAPLRDVQCSGGGCLSPDGGVRISGFPGGTGIARAYASAYDPADDTTRFPGLFADNANNLLISSGFSEINLFDDEGEAIHEVSTPLSVRFEARRTSWATLPDLRPGSGRVELPMYSFDQATGEWVAEADGVLERDDGTPVGEAELDAIRAGTYGGRLFVAFSTKHFSTFNCDQPIQGRACVKGRLVTSTGEAVAGAQVSIDGASYTGNAGVQFTGADGYFASDVMKSELPGEDVDRNRKTGEAFSARVVAVAGPGLFAGAAFQTPTAQGSVGVRATTGCRPPDCECLDLGDVVVNFETPRLCQITVRATFSGEHEAGDGGPLVKGDAVANARVYAEIAGGLVVPQSAAIAACAGQPCNGGTTSADGGVTFAVPIVGAAPQIKLKADLATNAGGTYHYYVGNVDVAGCVEGQAAIDATVAIDVKHASLGDLGSFIDALGAAPPPPPPPNPLDPSNPGGTSGRDCDCHAAGSGGGAAWCGVSLVALGLALARRRAHRPG